MAGVGNTQTPTSAPAPATQLVPPQPDPSHVAAFGGLDPGDVSSYGVLYSKAERLGTNSVLGHSV